MKKNPASTKAGREKACAALEAALSSGRSPSSVSGRLEIWVELVEAMGAAPKAWDDALGERAAKLAEALARSGHFEALVKFAEQGWAAALVDRNEQAGGACAALMRDWSEGAKGAFDAIERAEALFAKINWHYSKGLLPAGEPSMRVPLERLHPKELSALVRARIERGLGGESYNYQLAQALLGALDNGPGSDAPAWARAEIARDPAYWVDSPASPGERASMAGELLERGERGSVEALAAVSSASALKSWPWSKLSWAPNPLDMLHFAEELARPHDIYINSADCLDHACWQKPRAAVVEFVKYLVDDRGCAPTARVGLWWRACSPLASAMVHGWSLEDLRGGLGVEACEVMGEKIPTIAGRGEVMFCLEHALMRCGETEAELAENGAAVARIIQWIDDCGELGAQRLETIARKAAEQTQEECFRLCARIALTRGKPLSARVFSGIADPSSLGGGEWAHVKARRARSMSQVKGWADEFGIDLHGVWAGERPKGWPTNLLGALEWHFRCWAFNGGDEGPSMPLPGIELARQLVDLGVPMLPFPPPPDYAEHGPQTAHVMDGLRARAESRLIGLDALAPRPEGGRSSAL